ncbi:aminotransferase class I/II-fold pyridoxal phosphate-dependent enzyme [Lentibacillus sp. N15]|uniref:DegT/DnrJ/EryC1/StrS family aminotransferase n=1 Tax=Lentibacillus songyuanensis TaxID=3136161 RepID=UPI0031B9EB0E
MSGKEQLFLDEAFQTNWVAPLGPHVDAFEQEVAEYVGMKAACAVSSGTAAIHLALALLGVKSGDRVFCSTLSFVASANPILYQGAEPVFIDSEPNTWNMSPSALKHALHTAAIKGKLPKAVIVVHLYGQSARMDELLKLCQTYGVTLIEDAAESLGSTYKGKASGTFGYFGIYSFNGNKIITTSGGGMLVSNDALAMEKARFLASQARDQAIHYQHSMMGYNYRLSNLLAGVGRAQLQVLDERVDARRRIFSRYTAALADLAGVAFQPELAESRSNRWLTVLSLNENETNVTAHELVKAFRQENIEVRPVWKPLHMQPLFQAVDYYPHYDGEHVAERLFQSGICLPSGSNLTDVEQTRVIACFRQTYRIAETSRKRMVLSRINGL